MALFFGALLAVEMMRQEENRLYRRMIRDAQDPFSISETEFILNYRLTKAALSDLIQFLDQYLDHGRYSNRIPTSLRVLAAVHFFAAGSYQRSVGNSALACLSQPVVSRCIREVINIIARYCQKKWIKFPKNNQEKAEHAQRFFMRNRMRHITGIVDGTHVAIVTPHEDEHIYVNRKGYHSLNVQIICDADLKIINIVSKWPGSTHDAFVWRSSRIGNAMRANFENGDTENRIMGDSGYPCLPWLLVPLPNPNTDQEQRFNNRFKRARSTVERCIGVYKARWRCLLKERTLHYQPRTAAKIIMACAVLHNIAIHYRVDNPQPVWDEIDIDHPQPRPANVVAADAVYRQRGQNSRQEYIRQYF